MSRRLLILVAITAGLLYTTSAFAQRIVCDYGRDFCRGGPYRAWTGYRLITRHEGIDFRAPIGMELLAATNGIVTFATAEGYCGGRVFIDTQILVDGPARAGTRNLRLKYNHIIPLVNEGDLVKVGDVVAMIQNPADAPDRKDCVGDDAHLHFALEQGVEKNHVNPHDYWVDTEDRIPCYREGMDIPTVKIVSPFRCGGNIIRKLGAIASVETLSSSASAITLKKGAHASIGDVYDAAAAHCQKFGKKSSVSNSSKPTYSFVCY